MEKNLKPKHNQAPKLDGNQPNFTSNSSKANTGLLMSQRCDSPWLTRALKKIYFELSTMKPNPKTERNAKTNFLTRMLILRSSPPKDVRSVRLYDFLIRFWLRQMYPSKDIFYSASDSPKNIMARGSGQQSLPIIAHPSFGDYPHPGLYILATSPSN